MENPKMPDVSYTAAAITSGGKFEKRIGDPLNAQADLEAAPILSPSISQDAGFIEAVGHSQPHNAMHLITSPDTVIDNATISTQRDKKAGCLKSKIKSFLLSPLVSVLERARKPPSYDDFLRIVHVEIQDQAATGGVIARHGVVMIDSQCQKNLMGRKFAALFGKMLQSDTSYPILTTLTGEEIKSVGVLEARWHFKDVEDSRLHSDPMYYRHTFEVLESWDSSFDLIVGLETIRELGLLKSNHRIAAPSFRRLPPPVDKTTAAREQLEAEEKRRQEEARMRKHEEEKAKATAAKGLGRR